MLNYQTKAEDLQALTETEARSILLCRYADDLVGNENSYLDYYATPYTFLTAAGPFGDNTIFAERAYSVWTIEAWVIHRFAVIFCKGEVVRVINDFDGIGTLRLY